jgi:hypothetical protein
MRPATAQGALHSPQTVAIYLPDAADGTSATCAVAGFAGGTQVNANGAAAVQVRRGALAPVTLALASPKANGQSCAGDVECQGGLCVDGVCCRSTCGLCQACNVAGSEGTCTAVGAGTPNSRCAQQPVAGCGFDGTCDGNGGCRRFPLGVACAAAVCQANKLVPAAACDGFGMCVTSAPLDCAPFTCDGAASPPGCRTSCTVDGDCVPGNACLNGSCGTRPKQANGAGCLAASDCTSNNCVEGVCCDGPCDTACNSCNQMGSVGMCSPVAAGAADPRGRCMDQGVATCGTDGLCDGAGACARYPSGTLCMPGTCPANAHIIKNVFRCDSQGRCAAAADIDCTPYRCDRTTTTCLTSCTTNTMCAGGGVTCDVDAGVCQ